MNDPELYRKFNDFPSECTREVLNEFRENLNWKRDEVILDVGCGPGDVTTHILGPILGEDAQVVGCDKNENMIRYGQEKFGTEMRRFITLDISTDDIQKTLNENSFDKVFSFFCFHLVHNRQQMAKNFHKLLKQNGEGLFVDPIDLPVVRSYEVLQKNPRWKPFIGNTKELFCPYMMTDNAEEDCKKDFSDFSVVEVTKRKCSYTFPSIDALREFAKSVNAFLYKIPEGDKEDYLKDFVNILLSPEFCSIDSLGIQTTYTILIIYIKK